MIKGEVSMKKSIIYVGLDVDDTQYHGSAFDKNTGEVITFKCRESGESGDSIPIEGNSLYWVSANKEISNA